MHQMSTIKFSYGTVTYRDKIEHFFSYNFVQILQPVGFQS